MSGIRGVDVYRSTTTVRATPVSRPTSEGGLIAGYMFGGNVTLPDGEDTQIVQYDSTTPRTLSFLDYFAFDNSGGFMNCLRSTYIYVNAHARVVGSDTDAAVTLDLHGFDTTTALVTNDLFDINTLPSTHPIYGDDEPFRTVHFSDMVFVNEGAALYLSARYNKEGGAQPDATISRVHFDIIVIPDMGTPGGA